MPYKMVAIDVDGTLINKEFEIPSYNKEVISKLYAEGIHFVIASGRNDVHVKKYIDELGIDSLVIGCNGAQVRDLETNETFVMEMIEKPALKEVLDFMEEENIIFKAFSMDTMYHTKNIDKSFLEMATKAGLHGKAENALMKQVEMTIDEIVKEDIIKVIVTHDSDKAYLTEVQKKLFIMEELHIARSAETCVDMAKKGVSKGGALKVLAQRLGLQPEEIVAIGDGENDKEMLQYAGFSVAMGNAPQELKDIADMVTGTSTEAGLGKALWKIFKEQ